MNKARLLWLAVVLLGRTAFAVVVADDPFTDSSHNNTAGGDALGLVYYRTTTSAGAPLAVSDDSAGIGFGNALLFSPNADLQKLVANFTPATLAAAGDSVRLTFDLRFTVAPASAGSALRFGLYFSNATRQTSEPGGSIRNDDKGYAITMNPGAASSFTVQKEDTNGSDDILGGTVFFSSIGASAGGTVPFGTTKHSLTFQISRLANGDLEVRGQIDGLIPSVATVAAASVLTYTFDEFGIATTAGVHGPYYLDNLRIVRGSLGTVTLDAPAADTVLVVPPVLNLSGTASDLDGVAKVEFYDVGVKLGESTASPYGLAVPNPLPGIYSLSAVLVDNDGSSVSSSRVGIRVDGATPDEFDTLRAKWVTILTGGDSYSLSDSNVQSRVNSITSSAQSNWNTMDKSVGRPALWSDLTSTSESEQITTAYNRLRSMALAVRTHGSSLENNAALRADVISGLDWMYANRYNETKNFYDNWWDWEIGVPLAINDIVALIYESLTPTQVANYMAAIDKFTPQISPSSSPGIGAMTGANRVWKASIVALRGVLLKKSAEVAEARDGLSEVFDNVTTGDGFYADGSFIQHVKHPYTGGYGVTLIGFLAPVLQLLTDSTWQVTDPDLANLYGWVRDAFEPVIYRGAIMDMLRGREISRMGGQDHGTGHSLIQNVLRVAELAPEPEAAEIKGIVKSWIQTDTFRSFLSTANLPTLLLAKAVLNDTAIIAKPELVGHWTYAGMDRVVHRRPGYGFGISMNSSRIYRYESGNGENLRGWFTSDGATWLYNDDLGQLTDFWPTVNHYRLPGTTVDTVTRADSSGQSTASSFNWAGGATLAGSFGSAGMELAGYSNSLTARKSWFMFDDEIVALGSAINSTDNRTIETIVENRKLSTAGIEAFTVDGVAQPSTLGWSGTLNGASWCHLAGVAGYYFPGGARVNALREARTGSWSLVNDGRAIATSTTPITRNYLTLWFDHGSNPANATYAYAILPNKSAAETSAYASVPQFQVLDNSAQVQAVRETNLGIDTANFWTDTVRTAGAITCNRKASVMMRDTIGEVELAVSDPTQANSGTITVELARSAIALVSADPGISIQQLSPTIIAVVNVNGAAGKTFSAKFQLPTPPSIVVEQPTGTELTDSTSTVNFGARQLLTSGGALSFTVRNVGGSNLTDLNLSIGGAHSSDYILSTAGMLTTLTPGASTTFSVTFTPSASGTRTASLQIGSNVSGAQNPFGVKLTGTGLTPQEVWRQSHFGTTGNTGNAADLFDFDKDGLVNLVEYAFGLNPIQAGSMQLPQPERSGGNFVVRFTQPAGVSGITYGAQWSTILSNNPADWTAIPDSDPSSTGYTFSVPIGANPKMFMRFQITSP